VLRARHFVALSLAVSSFSAHAEVSDKVASPQHFWIVAALVAASAFVFCHRWPRASLLIVPLLGILAWYFAYGDQEAMTAYCLEVGAKNYWSYRLQVLASSVLVPTAAAIGGLLGWLKSRRHAA
jgi:hypothetical protein